MKVLVFKVNSRWHLQRKGNDERDYYDNDQVQPPKFRAGVLDPLAARWPRRSIAIVFVRSARAGQLLHSIKSSFLAVVVGHRESD